MTVTAVSLISLRGSCGYHSYWVYQILLPLSCTNINVVVMNCDVIDGTTNDIHGCVVHCHGRGHLHEHGARIKDQERRFTIIFHRLV